MKLINSTNFITLTCLSLASQGLLSCGHKTTTTAATVASTDERPDISDDRRSVHITAGTRDSATIHAKDLSGLVTGVPNIDTGATSTQKLTGSYILAVAQNPRTNLVAIGVRSFSYVETDFSMVFVINPAVPDKPQLVSFEAPGQKTLSNGTTKPMRSIRSMSFDASGILHVVHTDASDSRAEVLINRDLTIRSCKYLERGEGHLCGESK